MVSTEPGCFIYGLGDLTSKVTRAYNATVDGGLNSHFVSSRKDKQQEAVEVDDGQATAARVRSVSCNASGTTAAVR